jgi:hypothetical protein
MIKLKKIKALSKTEKNQEQPKKHHKASFTPEINYLITHREDNLAGVPANPMK